MSFLLGSFWSDSSLQRQQVVFENNQIEGSARLRVQPINDRETSATVILPLVLRGVLRNLNVHLPDADLVLDDWPGSGVSSIGFEGDTSLRARTIRFVSKNLRVGTLSQAVRCHLEADNALGDQQMTLPVVNDGSELTVQGVFVNRYPWNNVATVIRPESSTDDLGRLLVECERRFQNVKSLVTTPNYDPTIDGRVEWSGRFGDLLPRLLRGLVEAGLAKKHAIHARGDTKIRVSPTIGWSQLRQIYDRPTKENEHIRKTLMQLK